MRVYRFMSSEEFSKFTGGVTLVNRRRHSAYAKSTAVGFCFFAEEDRTSEKTLIANWHFQLWDLFHGKSCKSRDDVIVCFDVNDALLTKAEASYFSMSYRDTTEWCATSYDNATFHMVKWGIVNENYTSPVVEMHKPLTITWF